MGRKRRGNHEGSVYFSDSKGLWRAVIAWRESGRLRRRSHWAKTKAEAVALLHQLQLKHLQGATDSTATAKFGDLLSSWLEDVARVNVKPTTFDGYERKSRLYIRPKLGDMRIAQLSAAHVSRLLSEMERKGLSSSYRSETLTIIRQVCQWAVASRVIAVNPCDAVQRPRKDTAERNPWNAEEVRQFLKEAKTDRLYALFVMAATTGIRSGELYGLQWPDIDLEKSWVSIQRKVVEIGGEFIVGPPKTAKSRRQVVLTSLAIDALHAHRCQSVREGHAGCTWVFHDRRGGPLRRQNVNRRSWRPIIQRAGLRPIRFHDLRHSTATLLLGLGVSPKIVQEVLGHANINVTLDTYSHVLPTMQAEAMDKLARLLG